MRHARNFINNILLLTLTGLRQFIRHHSLRGLRRRSRQRMKAFAFCLGVTGFVRPSISEALADDAGDNRRMVAAFLSTLHTGPASDPIGR